jgi:hypothetical protein
MPCKLEIRKTIDKSVADKTQDDFWGFTEKQARKIAVDLNSLWGSIATIAQTTAQGGWRIMTSRIDDAVNREFDKQKKAEESFERDLDFFNGDRALFEQETKEQRDEFFQLDKKKLPPAQEKLDNQLLKFLTQFGVTTKEIGDFKKRFGVDALGATDVMQKLIYLSSRRNVTTMPEEAAHMMVMLMGKNSPLIKEAFTNIESWSGYNTVKKQYMPIYKDEYKVKIEALGHLIRDAIVNKYTSENPIEKSLFEKIKDLIENFFKGIRNKFNVKKNDGIVYDKQAVIKIAEGMLSGDASLVTSQRSFRYSTNVDYYKALEKDPLSKGIVEIYTYKLPFKLAGSLAIAKQTNIERWHGEQIHDLDFKVPQSWMDKNGEEGFDKLMDKSNIVKLREIRSEGSNFYTKSYLQAPKGYRIEMKGSVVNSAAPMMDINVYDEKGNRLTVLESLDKVKTLDFFIGGEEETSFENVASWQDVFNGKLNMSILGENELMFVRPKDQTDYINVNPVNIQESRMRNLYFQLSPEIKEGVQEVFDSNPELASIGTAEQYSAYLDSIFPDSQVKDVVYRGGEGGIANEQYYTLQKDYAERYGKVQPAIINLSNPIIADRGIHRSWASKEVTDRGLIGKDYPGSTSDAVIEQMNGEEPFSAKGNFDVYVVKNSNQTHVLGNKQDIEGFKKFVGSSGKTMLQKEGTESSTASPKTLALVKDFLKRIGVDINGMKEIVVNGVKQNANGAALITQNLVQVVEGTEGVSLSEEAMHFAVEIIKQTNPSLYKTLLKEINNYALYKQVTDTYGTDPNYQGKDGKPDILKLKDEAIAKVLVETIINQNEGSTEKPELLAKSQSWWSSMVEWLKGLFMKSGFDRAAMDIITGKEIGTVEDIRAEEGKVFLQKSRQQSAIDKIREMDARLTKKEVLVDGEKKDRYFLDGVTQIARRVSDEIQDWYSRRFRGGEILKSQEAKAIDDLKAEKGTKGHNDFEYLIRGLNDGRGGVLVDENGHLRDVPLDDSGYVPQIDPEDPNRNIYRTLKDNLLERLRSLNKVDDEGNRTVFLSEMQIFDPKTNKAGTIDLMAITPEGRVNLLDWKFMALSDSYEEIPWYKVAAWKNQMDQYKTMLINAYGIKEEQFDQTRMIPIKAKYSEGDIKQRILPELIGVEIGAVDPKDITDAYLVPVGLEEERTGNDDVDKLLKKLNADYRKLSEKTVLPSEKKTKAEQLNALFTAIRQLQMRQNLKPLLEQAKVFNSSIKNLMERFENNWKGNDPKSFSEEDVNAFVKEILDAEKALGTYTTLDIDLADLFIEGEDPDLENDLAKTVKIARSLENKLNRMKTEFVKNFIGKAEEVEDITKEEKTISGLAKWWSDTATIQLNSAKVLFRKANRALTFAAMDTVDQSKKLQTLKDKYDAWAKGKGLTGKNYFDILKKKGTNELIDEYQADFYKELQKRINSKDPDLFKWVKDNINISEYNAFLKEEIASEKTRIIEKYKDREQSDENEQKMNNELNKVDKMYNTSTKDGAGWFQYELIKKFPKEKWQTSEWKELHAPQNQAALDFYNYIRERNEYYRSIGYLGRGEDRTFLPWVRKSLVEKIAMGGNISLGEQFLKSISMSEGDIGFGKIDPHTGRPIDTIPKYFTTELEEEASEDLFKNMALYNEMAIKFKYLSEIENQALALIDLERNKETIRTSNFSRTQYKNGKIDVSPDNSKNAELIESMVKGIIYGQKYLQNDTFDQALATFGKFGEKVNAKLGFKLFPEGLSGRQVSLNKSIDTLNKMFQTKVMGLNLLSATSNLFGGTAQSIINSGKYFTKSDYLATEAWINSKMIGLGNTDFQKKAIGALEYFLPLTENYNREFAKKLSLSTLNQENIQDAMFMLMRQSDKHVQTVNFYSFLKNSIVQDGEVVNAREFLKKSSEYANFYEGTDEQRKARETKFEEDVAKLIEEKGVLKLGQVVDNEFVIPGVERKSESVVALRRKIQQLSKDALGNATDDSRRLIDMNVYGNSFMMFKRWIPRLVDVRAGDLKYNSASDAYEWGRMRTVYGMLSLDLIKSVKRLSNTLSGNEKGVEYMREMWEKKKEEYERETGKTLNMTESEFMDLVRRNVKSQMVDTLFFLSMIGLFIALKANAPDDDEDPAVKNQYKFMLRAVDKLKDEIQYFYNPANLLQLVSGGLFPSIGLLTNFGKLIGNFMEEVFGLVLQNDEWVESAKPIKYLMKQFPISNQIVQYLPMFVPDVAKDLGIKAQSQSGFIH